MNAEKVCLIAGGSSGIGAEIARHLASLGYGNLAIVARRKEKLEEVAKECQQAGAKDVLVVVKDLSDLKQAESAVKETVDKYGRLDIVVANSAMVPKQTGFTDLSVEDFQSVLNLNVISQVVVAKAALPHLEVTKGNIVFMSSIAGKVPVSDMWMYSISKAALDMAAKIMAISEAPKGVRVNVVSPGPILTDLLMTALASRAPDNSADQLKEQLDQNQPTGSIGDVGDVARLVAYLVDEKNKFLIGADIVIDGGLSLKSL